MKWCNSVTLKILDLCTLDSLQSPKKLLDTLYVNLSKSEGMGDKHGLKSVKLIFIPDMQCHCNSRGLNISPVGISSASSLPLKGMFYVWERNPITMPTSLG